ncbi:putative threonine--tRNA ligase 2, cytoplasmic [Bagarius yarrelli]|uniref:threonine--tRNA ligase n=1 Tax=Bagarius yarrelli TaxID=175774 RepID=A0A556U1L3_BAGYA|nr:putative threonine--tRNA ligase 2, cytoplasmic [Bagarius yarrelli]
MALAVCLRGAVWHETLSQSERLRLFEIFSKRSDPKGAEPARELSIRLADGRTLKGVSGVTTPLAIAQDIRVKGVVVSRVSGALWELSRPLEDDCELQLLSYDSSEGRQAVWKTGACVLASVMETQYGAQVCREGVSDTGVYCDYRLDNSSVCLDELERRCLEAAAMKLPIVTTRLSAHQLQQLFQDDEVRLRCAEEALELGDAVGVYRCGLYIGVCSGPLLPNTGFLRSFKMLQVSPATLACSPDLAGVQRILGVSFPGAKEREQWEHEQEEAKKRDHRRIGKDQELFFFNDVSPGSCFFLPKGAHIYNTLTEFIKSEYRRRGFSEVVTPTLYSTSLWQRSGHWEHYSENMFTVTCEPHTFALKPMNCPAHCVMYEQRVRSWRELPIRWADFGALHRNEHSGALGGLTRVRRFCQDDAHIFCTPEQLEEEMTACLDFVRSVYRVFGFTFHCLLSTRPAQFLGDSALWDTAEQIDIQIRDAIGRQHQCATIQLDFQLPIRFNLEYVGADGQMHRPVMVHRAVLGSLERMIAILAENFGGKWPFWLSPAQVMVLPVGDESELYSRDVVRRLKEAGFMADLDDDSGSTLNKKIRSAQLSQYNYIFVASARRLFTSADIIKDRRFQPSFSTLKNLLTLETPSTHVSSMENVRRLDLTSNQSQ